MPPSAQLREVFRDVQLQHIFQDSKTFADLHFSEFPSTVRADYQAHKHDVDFDLSRFVQEHFSVPKEGPTVGQSLPGESIEAYIARLWRPLRYDSNQTSDHSSLLPLPYPYVVPGGRFRELYYWDSYFTMLGLEADDHHDLALDMLKNFAFQIDCYGHVPNGNRTYYLSRSQPPFFSLMVDLIAEREGERSYLAYLPELQAEYEYWMDGSTVLAPGQSYRRVVRLSDRFSTDTGMTGPSHETSPIAKMSRLRSHIVGLRQTSTETFERQRNRDGISVLDGLRMVIT
jgi:alpha,alpha-trehalase